MNCKEEFQRLHEMLTASIIGQEKLVDRLLIALLADGHLLVEGAPGLAKTRAIKTLSDGVDANYQRIQFTPDLLPSDITGTEVFRPEDGSFIFQEGPIFHNLVLADEINRAPAKVQSALLEAMSERQVSVGSVTHPLPELFLVMATQNPIEQEGTYPLPEAQLDRFLMHVTIDYPSIDAERAILKLVRTEAQQACSAQTEKSRRHPERIGISQESIFAARQQVLNIHMAEPVEEYIVQLIMATREPATYHAELAGWIEFGASPRATISLDRCSRSLAWLRGNDFVTPGDVQSVIHDVLRHRIILAFEAEAKGISKKQVIDTLLDSVPAP
jgi:MoxR-like ATPase